MQDAPADTTALSQDATLGDWKRRLEQETKVNKELGRRLREMKQLLLEEKLRSQRLAARLQDGSSPDAFNGCTNKQSEECTNCKHLTREIRRLESVISQTASVSSQDSGANSDVSSTQCSNTIQTQHNPQSKPFSNSGLAESTSLNAKHQDGGCETDHAPQGDALLPLSTPVVKPPRAAVFPVSTAEQEKATGHSNSNNNQTQHGLHSHGYTKDENASLGPLFKYAVVLAGPTPTKARKSTQRGSFSDRFKVAEFRRSRSLPECQESLQESPIPSSESVKPQRISSVGKWKAAPGGNGLWPTKRQQQSALDYIIEDKTPSSLRRAAAGLFSSLVPNGLRSTPSPGAPSTPPLPHVSTKVDPTTVGARSSAPTGLQPTSQLLCVFPPAASEAQELEGLLEICFPYGEQPPVASDFSLKQLKRTLQERHRTYRSADSTFVHTITSASNPTEITYAICVRSPLFPEQQAEDPSHIGTGEEVEHLDAPAQCCLCLLSPYPFFSLFFKVLYGIAVLWTIRRREAEKRNSMASPKSDKLTAMLQKPLGMLDFVELFQDVMERLKQMQVPSMGGWSRMVLSPKVTQLSFHRPHSENMAVERRHLLLEYAAPTLFGLLSVDQVLFLLGCLCCEQKVLVVSDHVNIVSSCVLALITLLHPLQWAGPVITVLPPRLDELLEAPVPLIAGRVSIASASSPNFSTLREPMKDVIEVNMDQNNLHMHDEDLAKYHELKLPECDELVHELEPFSSQLFGKHDTPDFPTVQQDEACKIMCARIHRHIQSICTMAMVEEGGATSVSSESSPAKRSVRTCSSSSTSSSSSHGSAVMIGSHRRCSAMVADYIQRFQETQMFSMFTLEAQNARMEREEAERDEIDEDEDEDMEGKTYASITNGLNASEDQPNAREAAEKSP